MGQDPKEVWRKLQQTMSSAQQRGRGSLPGGPRNFLGGAAGLLLLGTGVVVVVNNALFNGMHDLGLNSKVLAKSPQWTVAIELSSTQG